MHTVEIALPMGRVSPQKGFVDQIVQSTHLHSQMLCSFQRFFISVSVGATEYLDGFPV